MYFKVGRDWSDGGFGALQAAQLQRAVATARRSVVPRIAARPPVYNMPPLLKSVELWGNIRRGRLRRAIARLNQRMVVQRPLLTKARATLQGYGYGFGDATTDDEALRDLMERYFSAQLGFNDLLATDRTDIGESMLTTRAAEIAADLGIPTDRFGLSDSSAFQTSFWANAARQLGGGEAAAVSLLNFGEQVSGLFSGQSGTLDELLGLSQDLKSKFGDVWNDLSRVTGDLSGIMEGGVRDVMDKVFGSGSSQWLNARTVNQVVGIARSWSATNYDSPASIASTVMTTVGTTIAVVGAAIPPPPGAIVAAVGAAISIIGTLIDFFSGDEFPPPPEIDTCSYTPLGDADAWAVLRLYLHARGDYPANTSIEDIRREWGARFDPHTGEVMVSQRIGGGPASGSKRILDVFDRQMLHDAYMAGAFNDWVWGKMSLSGADPIRVAGSAWLMPGDAARDDNAEQRALWCTLSNTDVANRGYLSNVTSSAMRFRVYGQEFGNKSKTRTDHGPNAIGWRSIGQSSDGTHTEDGFYTMYRSAQIVSAYLGGTAPYGFFPSGLALGHICTGVGGELLPDGRWKNPIVVGLGREHYGTGIAKTPDGRPIISLLPPTVAVARNWGRYTIEGQPVGSTRVWDGARQFDDIPEILQGSEPSSFTWNVPTPSPKQDEISPMAIAAFQRPLMSPMLAKGSSIEDAFKREMGMSSGAKWALGLSAAALLGGGGYYLWSRGKKR